MSKLFSSIFITVFLFGINTGASAADDKRHSGVETSAEHKSDAGLEHGEAYAGSKEKKDKDNDEDNDYDGDKDKKDKKEKKQK
jgi:hypothetical protein